MSILWSYLLRQYGKIFALSILTFIAILVVSRLETVAEFAALGTPLSKIFLFLTYQIPYVLPLAIPISSLIAAMILFLSLSHSHELTALRSSGFSIFKIITPLLFAALFLCSLSFYICSEVATTAHLKTRKMAYEFSSVNPLILLQNSKIAKLQGAFVSMEPVKPGERVKNVQIAGKLNRRLFLYLIEDLQLKDGVLEGKNATFISSHKNRLAIENQRMSKTSASDFAFLLRPKGWKIANDHLNFALLRARQASLKSRGGPKMEKNLIKSRSEIARRFSLSFSVFTFTLMGIACGIEISRNQSKRGIITAVLLGAFSLLSFFIAHELDHLFFLSLALLVFPHILIGAVVFLALFRVQRGHE